MDEALARDFLAIWQSELTAMAADRELRENFAAMTALWVQAAATAAAYLPREPAAGSASPAQPPGAPASAAAPQPGLDEIGQLNRRVAELEQQLARLLGAGHGPATDSDSG